MTPCQKCRFFVSRQKLKSEGADLYHAGGSLAGECRRNAPSNSGQWPAIFPPDNNIGCGEGKPHATHPDFKEKRR